MNQQNRTADGRIASVKEAQRADCKEMISRYMGEASDHSRHNNFTAAQDRVTACAELRAAFFADYAEAI